MAVYFLIFEIAQIKAPKNVGEGTSAFRILVIVSRHAK